MRLQHWHLALDTGVWEFSSCGQKAARLTVSSSCGLTGGPVGHQSMQNDLPQQQQGAPVQSFPVHLDTDSDVGSVYSNGYDSPPQLLRAEDKDPDSARRATLAALGLVPGPPPPVQGSPGHRAAPLLTPKALFVGDPQEGAGQEQRQVAGGLPKPQGGTSSPEPNGSSAGTSSSSISRATAEPLFNSFYSESTSTTSELPYFQVPLWHSLLQLQCAHNVQPCRHDITGISTFHGWLCRHCLIAV